MGNHKFVCDSCNYAYDGGYGEKICDCGHLFCYECAIDSFLSYDGMKDMECTYCSKYNDRLFTNKDLLYYALKKLNITQNDLVKQYNDELRESGEIKPVDNQIPMKVQQPQPNIIKVNSQLSMLFDPNTGTMK